MSDKDTFDVLIEFYGYKNYTVEAESVEEAEGRAMAQADSEYEGRLKGTPVNYYVDEVS